MNITMLEERGLIQRPLTVVINCRPDRVERNGQMGKLCATVRPNRIVLVGEQTRSARVGVPKELLDRVCDLGGPLRTVTLLDACPTDIVGDFSIAAIGNIHGQGEVLLHEIDALPTDDALLTDLVLAR
jgi:hypothetical protein